MIEKLHEKINNIVSIDGLEYNYDNNQCEINYSNNYVPTEEQLQQINQILNEWPLERAKLIKLELLDNEWNNIISQGWITPYGWSLGLKIEDVSLLNGAFTLAKEAANLGIESPIFIIDTDGLSHSLTINELTVLMLQYGQARALLSAQDSQKRTSIKNATSISELESI